MALRVRTDEEVRVLKREMRTLVKTPVNMIAHKLDISYPTAEHLSAMMMSEIRSWEIEEIER